MKKFQTILGNLVVLVLVCLMCGIFHFQMVGILPKRNFMAIFMLFSTTCYLLIGSILKAFKKNTTTIIIGHTQFVFLCITLFYSGSFLDLVVFFMTMIIVLHTLVKLRERMKGEQ